jgi:hypothetical protein
MSNDSVMDSILSELKTMKLTESGLLALGDSSALNDNNNYRGSNSISGNNNNNNNIGGGSVWGNKSIWESPPHSPSTSIESMKTANNSISSINSSNSKESVWASTQTSPILSGNLHHNPWDTSSTHSASKSLNFSGCSNPATSTNNNESLGSIWMIPPVNVAQKSWDAPVPPSSFKSPSEQFQLLRPHDIGNHIWCPEKSQLAHKPPQQTPAPHVAATVMMAPRNTNFQLQKPPPLTYTPMMTSTPIKPLPPTLGTASNSLLTANSCLQLFSDEFINYLNMIN